MSIIQFPDEQSLLDAIKAEAMANGNLSIRGVARLADVDDRGILRGADFKSAKLGEKLTSHGFTGADLLENGFPPQAVILALQYFGTESKVKSTAAVNLLLTFGTIGLMKTLEQLSQEEVVQEEKTPADIFLESAIAFKQQELRLKRVEQEQQAIASQQQNHENHLKGIDAELGRLQSPEGHYFSVVGFAILHGIKLGKEQAKTLGTIASAYCRDKDLRKEMVTDSKFGKVGNYPQEALRYAFIADGLLRAED